MIYTSFLFRIFLSLLLGVLIGLERQLTGHPAGIRINVLICMGTSFFTLFPMLYGSDQMFRVGSSIISGVGFLCSGVILDVYKRQDLDYLESIEAMIQNGASAAQAVKETGDTFAAAFSAMDDAYMQARATDVQDISTRVEMCIRDRT